MVSLCFSREATVVSPFCSSVFHFLAKLSEICEIFFSCEKKTMKLSLLHEHVNTPSHRKGNLMALTGFISSVMTKHYICPANYHYPGRDRVFELSVYFYQYYFQSQSLFANESTQTEIIGHSMCEITCKFTLMRELAF